ncbi:hypothetical protein ACTU45_33670 [Streptomyces sp. 24-1644]|uniref:hypothetical protein n=1 Tax=Streptomyces sp. 24-1644 TaxID=3457315 RepID=UPI003FA68405
MPHLPPRHTHPRTNLTKPYYHRARDIRDQQMIARRPDLCLAFVHDADEVLPLEERAAAAGIPVQRYAPR